MYLFVDVFSLFGGFNKFLKVLVPEFLGFFFCPFSLSSTMMLDSEIDQDVSELPLLHELDVVIDINEVFNFLIDFEFPSSLFLNRLSDAFRDIDLVTTFLTIMTRTFTVLENMFNVASIAGEGLTFRAFGDSDGFWLDTFTTHRVLRNYYIFAQAADKLLGNIFCSTTFVKIAAFASLHLKVAVHFRLELDCLIVHNFF